MPPMLINTPIRAGRCFYSFPASFYLFAAVGQLLCQSPWSPRKRRITQKMHAMLLHVLQPNPIELPCSVPFLVLHEWFCRCTLIFMGSCLCAPLQITFSVLLLSSLAENTESLWEVAISRGVHSACFSLVSVLLCCSWCHQPVSP